MSLATSLTIGSRRVIPERSGSALHERSARLPARAASPRSAGLSDQPRDRLVAALREHALVIGEVTLTSGKKAQYYVDAKRAILRPEGFIALGELVADQARQLGVTA